MDFLEKDPHHLCKVRHRTLSMKVRVLQREMNMCFDLLCLLDPNAVAQHQANDEVYLTDAEISRINDEETVIIWTPDNTKETSSTESMDSIGTQINNHYETFSSTAEDHTQVLNGDSDDDSMESISLMLMDLNE